MAGNSTISIGFKLDYDGGIGKLTTDAKELQKAMSATVSETERFGKNVVNFSAFALSIDAVTGVMRQLTAACADLSAAYAVQEQAETQLATVMQQRMNATAGDVDAIKQLAAAQQELGVIGDEVQLSGAQQLATFLSQRQSLELLIPAMNNLLAQQKGLNATSSDAVSIGNLMGKAMQGQTSALRRVGITFNDAQEAILKYGTESERAATLAQVITQNVGDMNAALAATPTGQVKKLENTLGDIKEKLGQFTAKAMPFLTMASQATVAYGGIVKLSRGIKALIPVLNGLTAAEAGASVGSKILAVSLRGLMIASGVGIAFLALGAALDFFLSRADEATEASKALTSAQERAQKYADEAKHAQEQETAAVNEHQAALTLNIAKLKDFNGTKEEEKKLVGEMNSVYGETMGYFSSVSDWYDTLIANSEAYCRQLVLEATARRLANQIAEENQKRRDILFNPDGTEKKYDDLRKFKGHWKFFGADNALSGDAFKGLAGTVLGGIPNMFRAAAAGEWSKMMPVSYSETLEKSDKEVADEAVAQIDKNLSWLTQQLEDVIKKQGEIKMTVTGGPKPGGGNGGGGKPNPTETKDPTEGMTLRAKLAKEIADLGEQYVEAMERGDKAEADKLYAQAQEKVKAREAMDQNYRAATSIPEESAPIEPPAVINDNAKTLKDISANIDILRDRLQEATVEEAAIINKEIDQWEKRADAIENAGRRAAAGFDDYRRGYEGLKGVSGGIENMTSALEGNANAWQTITGIIDGFLQIYDGINAIVGVVQMITQATQAQQVAEEAKTAAAVAGLGATALQGVTAEAAAAAQAPLIAANDLLTTSYLKAAAASFYAAHAFIPFTGFGIATGFVTAATKVVEGIGVEPFAEGGIISGPTIGLIGEYAGASNNPEVVAPLDKLRGMLRTDDGTGGKVTFKIDGRTLVGVLEKENNFKYRS